VPSIVVSATLPQSDFAFLDVRARDRFEAQIFMSSQLSAIFVKERSHFRASVHSVTNGMPPQRFGIGELKRAEVIEYKGSDSVHAPDTILPLELSFVQVPVSNV
jgi:hypothetical protein